MKLACFKATVQLLSNITGPMIVRLPHNRNGNDICFSHGHLVKQRGTECSEIQEVTRLALASVNFNSAVVYSTEMLMKKMVDNKLPKNFFNTLIIF